MEGKEKKFIFVTGGVVSSLGKGLASASIGRLMEAHGYRVSFIKLDPYINVDPGTMSPFQHGEVFVTDDGAETDSTWVITSGSLAYGFPEIPTLRPVKSTRPSS